MRLIDSELTACGRVCFTVPCARVADNVAIAKRRLPVNWRRGQGEQFSKCSNRQGSSPHYHRQTCRTAREPSSPLHCCYSFYRPGYLVEKHREDGRVARCVETH